VLGSTALASSAIGTLLPRRPGYLIWQRRIAGLALMGLGLRLMLTGDVKALRN
jgi:threonine/homoserine/homoserine lactone efflux protein